MIQVLENADLMEKRGHWQIYQSRQSCSSSRISGKIGAFKKIDTTTERYQIKDQYRSVHLLLENSTSSINVVLSPEQ